MFLLLSSLLWADTLTLDQALQLSVAHAPEARIAAAKEAEARANAAAALAPLLPQVTASGQYQHWDEGIEIPNFLNPGGDPIVVQAQDSLTANFTASQVIFAPSSFGRYGMAAAQSRGAAAAADGAVADLRLRVTQYWVAARSAWEFLELSRTLLEATQAHLQLTQNALQAGTVTPLAVDRAQLSVTEAKRRVLDAERNLSDLEGQLAALTGVEVTGFGEFPDLPADDPEVAAQHSADRPELEAADANYQAARAGNWTVIGDWSPTVSAIGLVRVTNSPGFSPNPTTWYVGLSATLPLLDGGTRFADARKVTAQQEQAEANLDRLQAATEVDLAAALRAETSARASLEVNRQAEQIAERFYHSTEAGYAAGTATALDVDDARNLWLNATVDRIRSEGAVVLAHAQILRLAGE